MISSSIKSETHCEKRSTQCTCLYLKLLCGVEELQHQLAHHCSTQTHRLSPTLWVAELDGAFVGKMGGHNEGGLMALLLYMTFRGGSVHCTGTYVPERFLV